MFGKKQFPVLILLMILLLAGSIYLGFSPKKPFTDFNTSSQMTVAIERENPSVKLIFLSKTLDAAKDYLVDYLIPVFVFLLPAIIALSMVLSGKADKFKDIIRFIETPEKERTFLIFLFAACLVFTLIINFRVFDNSALTADEFSYLFQADLISSGKIYVESPEPISSFESVHVVNNGKWYSKYTIGWPLLLSIGRLLNVPFLINPLLSSFSLVLLYLIGKKLYSPSVGLYAVFFAFISPFFIFHGGTYFSHTSVVFVSLLYLYLLISAIRDKSIASTLLAGAVGGFLPLVRPGDGLFIFFSLLPFAIWLAKQQKDYKNSLIKIGLMCILFMIGLSILFSINKIQTGDYFTFGFNAYDINEKWGFKVAGHNPEKGVWVLSFALMRISFWVSPFIGFFTFLSLMKKRAESYLLCLPSCALALFYFCYYGLGVFEIGSRFYLPAFVFMLIPAAHGLGRLDEILAERKITKKRAFALSSLLLIFLFMSIKVIPVRAMTLAKEHSSLWKPIKWILYTPSVTDPSVVFIGNGNNKVLPSWFIRNSWRLREQKRIFVYFSEEKNNRKVLEGFKNRNYYIYYFDEKTRRFRLERIFDRKE